MMAKLLDKYLKTKRRALTRAELEVAITNAVRASDPECNIFGGVIVERIIPRSRAEASWTVKGIRYGRADRSQCDAALAKVLKPLQFEFDVSD
jgi:hypothetical protein